MGVVPLQPGLTFKGCRCLLKIEKASLKNMNSGIKKLDEPDNPTTSWISIVRR